MWGGAASEAKTDPIAVASSDSAAGRGDGGLRPNVIAGLLILGLGLIGVLGGALAVTTSRRGADARVRRNDER